MIIFDLEMRYNRPILVVSTVVRSHGSVLSLSSLLPGVGVSCMDFSLLYTLELIILWHITFGNRNLAPSSQHLHIPANFCLDPQGTDHAYESLGLSAVRCKICLEAF